jgi:hypothetical protein
VAKKKAAAVVTSPLHMLQAHMDAMEDTLLQQRRISKNSGHPLHVGSPREAFVQTYLRNHIGENIGIGSGEIVNHESLAGEPRNQHDIVMYRSEYPKLHFGGNIDAFLAESVVATIEVKSTLTENNLKDAVVAAAKLKQLKQSFVARRATCAKCGQPCQECGHGYLDGFHNPPSVRSFVVAYGGVVKMATVYKWITNIHTKLNIVAPALPPTGGERVRVPSPSIDAIVVLGRGIIYFDNAPIGWLHDTVRQTNPWIRWVWYDITKGSLLVLFLHVITIAGGMYYRWVDPLPYLSGVEYALGFGA